MGVEKKVSLACEFVEEEFTNTETGESFNYIKPYITISGERLPLVVKDCSKSLLKYLLKDYNKYLSECQVSIEKFNDIEYFSLIAKVENADIKLAVASKDKDLFKYLYSQLGD